MSITSTQFTHSKLNCIRDIAEKIIDAHSITGAWLFLEALLTAAGICQLNGYTLKRKTEKFPVTAEEITRSLTVSIQGKHILLVMPAFGDIECQRVRLALTRSMATRKRIPFGLLLNPAQITVFRYNSRAKRSKVTEWSSFDIVSDFELMIEIFKSLRLPNLEIPLDVSPVTI